MRRASIIATLALGLTLTAGITLPCYCQLAASARNFEFYFHDLKKGPAPLNPVQRFVYSLVLAHTKPSPPEGEPLTPTSSVVVVERHT